MVDVDARLAEIEDAAVAIRAAMNFGGDYMPNSRVHDGGYAALARLLAVLKEQAGQIERLQREATGTVARGGGRSRASSDPTRFCRQSGPATYGDALCYCPSGACELDAAQATAERSLPDSAWPRCDSARPSASEASRLLTERDAVAALRDLLATVDDEHGYDPTPHTALDRLVAALVARDAELAEARGLHEQSEKWREQECRSVEARKRAAEVTQLRDALETVLDCRGDYLGTVSRRGGYPAICLACANKAREALAGVVPPEQAT